MHIKAKKKQSKKLKRNEEINMCCSPVYVCKNAINLTSCSV